MQRAFNYGHYKHHRRFNQKVKKPDLYLMLDNDKKLIEQLQKRVAYREKVNKDWEVFINE